ncbi:MAG: RelA/SpoT family protein [Patescibacteria group bacterium]
MTELKEIFNVLEEKINKNDKDLITRAYNFAKKAHEGYKRKSGDPYFVHVFETAKNLAKIKMDAQTIAAGFLHDVLEDTETKEEDLKKEFGEEIVSLVNGVTKLGTLKYTGYERHVESLRKFFIAVVSDLRVVIIKFADRLHNLQTLKYLREDKRERIALESIEIYASLANRLGMGKFKGDLEDAAFPHLYPKEYAQVEKIIKGKEKLYKKYLDEAQEELIKELIKNKIKPITVDYRIKRKYSLWKKLLKYNMDLDKIYDIIALRIIVENIEDCYKVLGVIHSIWTPLPGRIKDYIALPKTNGYKSIHTTVFTGSGGILEIQIKTREMHIEASYGIAAHFGYKEEDYGKNINEKNKLKWIEELKDFQHMPDDSKKFIEHIKMDFFKDRIFIFTPRGDVIDLPDESNPIDFAYSIHSDLGDHVCGAKINGKMSQIFTKLKNGDIVEILKKKDAHPSGKWLDYVKTSVAKKNIKLYLTNNSLLSKLKSFAVSKR